MGKLFFGKTTNDTHNTRAWVTVKGNNVSIGDIPFDNGGGGELFEGVYCKGWFFLWERGSIGFSFRKDAIG